MSETIIEPIEPFGLSTKHKKKSLFSKIGVVGGGREGRNIIRLTSSAGLDVTFIEISRERIDSCFKRLNVGLDHRIGNWSLTPSEKKMILGRIKGSLDYSDLKDCDFIIECIRHDEEKRRDTQLRKKAFEQIEEVVSPDAIIATNATTVIISELASGLKYKERCVSLHFPIVHTEAKLLEIVKGAYTSEEVYKKVLLFAKLIKYEAIDVGECNGLVNMRLIIVLLNEACQMVMENIAKMEDINRLMIIDYGMRMGIFQMADIIGVEKLVYLMEDMFSEYGDKKYKPNPIIWRLFRTKQLGRSTQRGFFLYENDKIVGTNPLFKD